MNTKFVLDKGYALPNRTFYNGVASSPYLEQQFGNMKRVDIGANNTGAHPTLHNMPHPVKVIE